VNRFFSLLSSYSVLILKIGPLKIQRTFESGCQKRRRKHELAEQIKEYQN
jgi:hypothetical protein